MNSVIRGGIVYLFLLIMFRLSGKRTMTEVTTFDFALLLIISETTQQAMIDTDNSITNAMLLIITLVGIDIALSLLKRRFPRLDKWVDDIPLVILKDGQPIVERLRKCRVDETDILQAARENHGLERLDQIRFAVLERSGGISIIPKENS